MARHSGNGVRYGALRVYVISAPFHSGTLPNLRQLVAIMASADVAWMTNGGLENRPRLAMVTTSSHNMAMRHVRIAELKARLSEYLRAVRRGETIAVLDRDTPIAQLVPLRDRAALRIRKPAPGTPAPNRVPLPKPSKLNIDIVQLLLEERQLHR